MTHVLVVEDSDLIREYLGELLKSEGFEVTVVPGGYEAISEITRRRPDVIVSDIQMPPPDGIRLVELLEAQGMHIPVVLITAQPVARPHTAGALLYKPFDIEQLLEAITRVAGASENKR